MNGTGLSSGIVKNISFEKLASSLTVTKVAMSTALVFVLYLPLGGYIAVNYLGNRRDMSRRF